MDYHPFEGTLVRLRAPEPADRERMHRWLNNPELTRHIMVRYPQAPESRRIQRETESELGFRSAAFSIDTLDGRHIGACWLGASPEDRVARLGIHLGEQDLLGKGYGTDALRVLCRFAFDMMDVHRVELEVFAENPRAIRAYEKVGFRHEGTLREADYRYGRRRDIVVMGLLRDELVPPGGA